MTKFKYKKKLITAAVAILLILVSAMAFFFMRVQPIIVDIAKAKIESITMSAINNSVFNVMSEKIEYNDLITVYSDNMGKINMLQADTVKINRLARETSRLSQDAINGIEEQGIDIPIGTLTGSPLLIGQGMPIHIKVTPIGTCNTELISEFEAAGINQTRHKIYLKIIAEVDIILPMFTSKIVIESDVLVTETILIGDVPETVMNINGGGLNFIPNDENTTQNN